MITNNILIKLKKRDKESIASAQNKLQSMQGRIEFLRDIAVCTNIRPGEGSYDIAVIAKYASIKDLESYLVHPVHVEVAKYIGPIVESVASVCYDHKIGQDDDLPEAGPEVIPGITKSPLRRNKNSRGTEKTKG